MSTKTTTATAALEAERLAAQAAEAIAKAEAARERAEEAGRRAEAERQAAVAAIRRRRLDAYDEAALEAEVKAARARFAQAIQAGEPGLCEFVEWQVALTRRYLVAVEAEVARAAVDPDRPAIPSGGPTELVYADEVQKVLVRIVANRVEDMRDEMQAELDAAGR